MNGEETQLINTGQLLGPKERSEWGQNAWCRSAAASTGARDDVEAVTEARLGGCF